jgi:hypothetical protein
VIPGVPSDNTTLLEVLRGYEADGYTKSLWAAADGKLRCEGCREEIDPSELEVDEIRRLEGASDPDDMMIVVVGRCGRCGSKVQMVLHYGPEASQEEAEALSHLEDRA